MTLLKQADISRGRAARLLDIPRIDRSLTHKHCRLSIADGVLKWKP